MDFLKHLSEMMQCTADQSIGKVKVVVVVVAAAAAVVVVAAAAAAVVVVVVIVIAVVAAVLVVDCVSLTNEDGDSGISERTSTPKPLCASSLYKLCAAWLIAARMEMSLLSPRPSNCCRLHTGTT